MGLTEAYIYFGIATVVIAVAGTYLTRSADQLADLTGWGEAIVGAVLLGGITSLPGIVTSMTAAYEGHAQLSVSNAIGGIAAQTFFLAIADITYPRINLEHAAASLANMLQGVLLILLLCIVLAVMVTPSIAIFNFHPASIGLIVIYILGVRMTSKAKQKPMWSPQQTKATVEDKPDEENLKNKSLPLLILKFMVLAVIVAAAGYYVAQSAIVISAETGLSEGFVGSLFTAVASSLPELIVSIAAVRQRALTLAVGNIIGGNSFDVLFVSFSDFAYADGSILHRVGNSQVFIIVLTLMLTTVLLMGLLYREKRGIGKIGWETFTMIFLFLAGYVVLYFIS